MQVLPSRGRIHHLHVTGTQRHDGVAPQLWPTLLTHAIYAAVGSIVRVRRGFS